MDERLWGGVHCDKGVSENRVLVAHRRLQGTQHVPKLTHVWYTEQLRITRTPHSIQLFVAVSSGLGAEAICW